MLCRSGSPLKVALRAVDGLADAIVLRTTIG
jgi:hypothetical protein